MISNYFDFYFFGLRIMIMIMNLEQKKIKTKLVWNHFDLKFILNYNTYLVKIFHRM